MLANCCYSASICFLSPSSYFLLPTSCLLLVCFLPAFFLLSACLSSHLGWSFSAHQRLTELCSRREGFAVLFLVWTEKDGHPKHCDFLPPASSPASLSKPALLRQGGKGDRAATSSSRAQQKASLLPSFTLHLSLSVVNCC